MLLNSSATDSFGVERQFEKPWFQNWLMFLGMMLVIIPESISVRCTRQDQLISTTSPNHKEKEEHERQTNIPIQIRLLIPAICDVAATIMMNAALVSIPVSIWQMLRGSIILFTALLTVFYRRKPLTSMQWLGVGVVFLSLCILGVTAVLSDASTKKITFSRTLVGVGLVVGAQCVQAFQTIVEEKFLHDSNTRPLLIVGFEGIWGILFCTFLFMPIAYFIPTTPGDGLCEDFWDSLVMLRNNPQLVLFSLAYMVSILLFNVTGMVIISATSALTRNILEPMRTMIVWVVSLLQFSLSNGAFGEPWQIWSWMQLGGFVLMTIGIFTYNNVWRICAPKLKPPQLPSTAELTDVD
ncbi:putative Solute carrier family 35 member F6 [Blattamonas nauphoetae]|uniref:Solute carrier family 35 member F6 n=1 Tax=Blattamonas nauphoetae TaxID=2049346 RepID=A0ABQ9X855_9EUKA|nr:putative Solute carrier family 35 member F6 [Blattamonas nauphoetae]